MISQYTVRVGYSLHGQAVEGGYYIEIEATDSAAAIAQAIANAPQKRGYEVFAYIK